MHLPQSISKLIESFERLPGIGPKSAQRLTFYLLHVPQEQLDQFADALSNLKKNTVLCSLCFNVSESDPCPICTDPTRDRSIILVVEQPLDVLALEKMGRYKGVYHVLHGAISPLNNIGPDELYIQPLLTRLAGSDPVLELILATNPTMEGEATAMYIANKVRELKTQSAQGGSKLKTIIMSRLGQGLPTGGDLEYADEMTLERALEGRRDY